METNSIHNLRSDSAKSNSKREEEFINKDKPESNEEGKNSSKKGFLYSSSKRNILIENSKLENTDLLIEDISDVKDINKHSHDRLNGEEKIIDKPQIHLKTEVSNKNRKIKNI